MKSGWLMFFFLVCVLMACEEDLKEEEQKIEIKDTPPTWSDSSPAVVHGAVSADLYVQTQTPSKVYWVITNQYENLSASDVKIRAEQPGDALGGIADLENGENTISVSDLEENTSYTAYFLAQNISDSLYQNTVKTVEFKTFTRQDTLTFTSVVENRTVDYLLYRPEEVLKNPEGKYPIAFFLAGYGEVATEKKSIGLIHNGSLAEYIHLGNDVPMIVMSIQHAVPNWNTELINEGIDHALKTYPIDDSKLYMIGMSGGAFGCWAFAQRHPERLAAIVPISGIGDPTQACQLKNLAVWAFHNGVDEVIHPGKTVSMINAINECNPKEEIKMLIFPDEGHDCWRRIFDPNHPDWKKSQDIPRIDLYNWLLSKSKSTQ